jgi:hypothetical protein
MPPSEERRGERVRGGEMRRKSVDKRSTYEEEYCSY